MRRFPLAVTAVALALSAGCATTAADRKYVRTFEPIPQGKSGELTAEESAVVEQLRQAGQHPAAVEYFGKMFQSAALVLWHFEDVTLTAQLKDGKYEITQGVTVKEPDFVIPLANDHVQALGHILSDNTISDEEAYQLHYVTFLPAVRAIFRNEALYNRQVAEQLALPNLIHMSLKNPKGYVFPKTTDPIWATAANVDGEWVVFEGRMGTPGMTIEVTREQAAEFTAMFADDAATAQDPAAQLDRVKAFLASVTTQSAR